MLADHIKAFQLPRLIEKVSVATFLLEGYSVFLAHFVTVFIVKRPVALNGENEWP